MNFYIRLSIYLILIVLMFLIDTYKVKINGIPIQNSFILIITLALFEVSSYAIEKNKQKKIYIKKTYYPNTKKVHKIYGYSKITDELLYIEVLDRDGNVIEEESKKFIRFMFAFAV